MNVSLSDHFTYKKISKLVISPILMMIFTSLYSIVDGFFISNFAGEDAFAGVNLIFPMIMIIGGIGFMFGTGGSALTSKYLGEQNKEKANKTFSMIVIFTLLVGLVVSFLVFLLIKPIANAMGKITNGTTQGMVDEAIIYGRILTLGQVAFMLQSLFHSFFVVDEKPKLGFFYTVLAGVANMLFDALFIAVFKWGVYGAAFATIIGYLVGGIGPLIHFLKNKNGNINLVKTKLEFKPIYQSCVNGSSEFVSNISSSIVGIVFNIQLLRYFSQQGVSACGIIMYLNFVFISIFIGYSIGMAPVVGYNYGAQNKDELKNVLRKSLFLIGIASLCMLALSEIFARPLSALFASGDEELIEVTTKGMRIYSISFLFCGFSIYLSSFFTALNNGLISAIISFLRTLVFQILFVLTLPLIIGKDGIWWSMMIAELAAFILSFIFLSAKQKKYGY